MQACACPQHRLVSVALFLNANHVAMTGTRRPLAVIPPGGVRTFLDVKATPRLPSLPCRLIVCELPICLGAMALNGPVMMTTIDVRVSQPRPSPS